MVDRVQVLVVGAGPCGLGAALGLATSAKFDDWLLVESAPVAGGLAGSVIDSQGFTWDFGGHVTFSRSDSFLEIMALLLGEDGWNRLERHALAVVNGNWLEYPIQQHWPQATATSREHLTPAAAANSLNFEEWSLAQFGPELTDAFFRPYNEKIWTVPLADLGTQWMKDRVALVTPSKRPWGPNAEFIYPVTGGAGAPWRRLAERLSSAGARIRYGGTVKAVDLEGKTARLHDQSEIRFGSLISTIPIDQLTGMIDIPTGLQRSAQQLRRTRVTVIGVGMRGKPPAELPEFTWAYFADPQVPFYRVSQLSAYATGNTPSASHWSLLVECSSPFDATEVPTDADVLDALRRVGLITKDHMWSSMWRAELAYGYPIPTLDRDDLVGPVLRWLTDRDCLSRGRFGDWAYETSGQDQAFQKGLDAALQLTGQEISDVMQAARHLLQG